MVGEDIDDMKQFFPGQVISSIDYRYSECNCNFLDYLSTSEPFIVEEFNEAEKL